MADIIYKIEFFSNWHCGSGLSSGAEADLIVVKDKNKLPFIPGKTIKGVLKDAAFSLEEVNIFDEQFIIDIFGKEAEKAENDKEPKDSIEGKAFFSNAELTKTVKEELNGNSDFIYRNIASTAIEDNGQAIEHSLRTIEVVVPLTLFGKIRNIPEKDKKNIEKCMQFTKRLGTGRNRGLGRCDISIVKEEIK